jgi:outer membrane murein-binding lipoprotein Lpp
MSDLAARLDQLDQEVEKVRGDVARFRHEGERHFVDQESTAIDPAARASLQRLDELAKSWHAIKRRVDDDAGSAAMSRRALLSELQRGIDEVRKAIEQPHKGERHFIDE